jgi:ABC-type lipoprotein release transport system permease subunit
VTAAASGLLQSLLFEVAPRDPLALGAVSALLLAATMAAAWLPARRASRVDPVEALRAE